MQLLFIIKMKRKGGYIDALKENGAINIVVFGDSITHGALNGFNDYETVYWNLLRKKLNSVRDSVPVNMINSGIGRTTAKSSLTRTAGSTART